MDFHIDHFDRSISSNALSGVRIWDFFSFPLTGSFNMGTTIFFLNSFRKCSNCLLASMNSSEWFKVTMRLQETDLKF